MATGANRWVVAFAKHTLGWASGRGTDLYTLTIDTPPPPVFRESQQSKAGTKTLTRSTFEILNTLNHVATFELRKIGRKKNPIKLVVAFGLFQACLTH